MLCTKINFTQLLMQLNSEKSNSKNPSAKKGDDETKTYVPIFFHHYAIIWHAESICAVLKISLNVNS